jgi:hypothetical protein
MGLYKDDMVDFMDEWIEFVWILWGSWSDGICREVHLRRSDVANL